MGINEERLKEIIGAGKLWCGDPETQEMARELLAYRESGALEALDMAERCLKELYPPDGYEEEHNAEFYTVNKTLGALRRAIKTLEAIEK